MISNQELKQVNRKIFGYIPKKIRSSHLHKIMELARIKDYEILSKLYFDLNIEDEKGCWVQEDWSNYRTVSIYKKVYRVHRLSYHVMISPLLLNKDICHHCDRKGCANPYHLFQGTREDNIRDYHSKYSPRCVAELKYGIYHVKILPPLFKKPDV